VNANREQKRNELEELVDEVQVHAGLVSILADGSISAAMLVIEQLTL
jgi:hypothetical protein